MKLFVRASMDREFDCVLVGEEGGERVSEGVRDAVGVTNAEED